MFWAGLMRSVCIEVPVYAIIMLCSRLVLCFVFGSLEEIESTSKGSSSDIGSDQCLVWGSSLLLGSLPVLGALKVPLCSIMVGAELG